LVLEQAMASMDIKKSWLRFAINWDMTLGEPGVTCCTLNVCVHHRVET
jgi:hypothetical protein